MLESASFLGRIAVATVVPYRQRWGMAGDSDDSESDPVMAYADCETWFKGFNAHAGSDDAIHGS